MEDKGLSEFKLFIGKIQSGDLSAEITFQARLNAAGEVEFDFGTMPISEDNLFIKQRWDDNPKELSWFALSGTSDDNTTLETDSLFFTTLREEWSKDIGRRMSPVGSCTQATFRRKLAQPSTLPVIRMHLKGFQNFGQLSAECPLGLVTMVGTTSIDNQEKLTGHITIRPDNAPTDIATWRSSVNKFLEHIRRVMSFAAAVVLRAPVVEYFIEDEVEIIALSQTGQSATSMRVIHYLDQQPVFNAAVTSFFNPPFDVKNLFYAIEWFAMDATYNEVRLINAMTVLENLVASNLEEDISLIRPRKEFEKIRRALRDVLRKCIEKWSTQDEDLAKEILADLNERLGDLNRRSILAKLQILVRRWSVPLDGISEQQIQAAKRARDLIVHRGHYYDEGIQAADELWTHVTVVREIVVRFLLTAIGYKGSYISFVGGMHHAEFPPQL